jgi:hypothetical protein
MNNVFLVSSHVELNSGEFNSMNIRAFATEEKAEEFADKLRALIQPDDKETIEVEEISFIE